jgi:phage shock protein PspC (stress-responsive transcriptional regulator)
MTETTHTVPPAGPAGPGGTTPLRAPLTRSRSDRKVAGVCGGVARHLGIDPVILRVLVVVLSIFGGSGLLLYAAGWLLIPDEGEDKSEVQRMVDRSGGAGATLAAVLTAGAVLLTLAVVVGIGSAFGQGWWWGAGPDLWPIVVVAGVIGAVWYVRRQPAGQSPPVAYTWTAPAAVAATGTTATPPPEPPPAQFQPEFQPQPQPPRPPRPRKEPSVLGAVTVSVALLAAGVMVLLDRTGAWHLHAVPFLAVLTGIVGLGLVVGAFAGRALWLTALGVVLTLATAVATVVPHVNGRTGDVTFAPTSSYAVPAASAITLPSMSVGIPPIA